MAAEVAFDVLEQILVRLDVKDIIRCRSVCKSWHSFISSPGFVKAHMNHDRENIGHRRIGLHDVIWYDETSFFCNDMYIVGSCNGLVCVSPTDAELVVTNPWTRESKQQQTPHCRPAERYIMIRQLVCFGFGYDASTDDYKVIVGFRNRLFEVRTVFHVLTLKSNTWKVIGEVEYQMFTNKSGVLCGGALHWFMTAGDRKVLMSLDLSTEECKEIPQPAEAECECVCEEFYDYRLGVIEECLCIYSHFTPLSSKKWVMKNNKWELYDNETKYDVAHCLVCSPVLDSQKRISYIYSHDDGRLVPSTGDHIRSSIFIKSLVSPHPHGKSRADLKGQLDGNDAKGNKRKRKHKRALV